MRLANPEALLLLLLIVPLTYFANTKRAAIVVPTLKLYRAHSRTLPQVILRWVPLVLRGLFVMSLSIALARPQIVESESKAKADALDMMLVLDTSGSMQATDFVWQGQTPTRLEVVKQVISEFIAARSGDRMGLVVFGSEAFTQSPLTLDHRILNYFLGRVRIGLAGESTAIGDAVVTAANRLAKAESKAPVIILLTDGASNAGRVDPIDAGEAAKAFGVKIYTIGVGKSESGADYDDSTLKKLAEMTHGQYFSAGDTEALQQIYRQIDQLERSNIDTPNLEHVTERYPVFIGIALLLMMLDVLFSMTNLRRIP